MLTMAAHKSRKVPTNLSLRGELVQRAKALGLNISEAVDAALEDVIRTAEREAWLRENEGAIADYNESVERRGVFSDDWRDF